jgi:hypothetical protein
LKTYDLSYPRATQVQLPTREPIGSCVARFCCQADTRRVSTS